MTLKVYGIPNCGTVKKARLWLEQQNIPYEFVNTREEQPSKAMITSWVKTLGNKPLRNTSGQSYRALGSDRDRFSDEQWIDLFANDIMLLKRPIFVKDGEAVLTGFRAKEEVLKTTLT
jgi:arsenate reductase